MIVNAPLEHQAAHVPDGHPEPVCDVLDVEEPWERVLRHVVLSRWSAVRHPRPSFDHRPFVGSVQTPKPAEGVEGFTWCARSPVMSGCVLHPAARGVAGK